MGRCRRPVLGANGETEAMLEERGGGRRVGVSSDPGWKGDAGCAGRCASGDGFEAIDVSGWYTLRGDAQRAP